LFGNSFMANLVFGNPQWDYKTFDFDKDVQRVHDKLDSTPFDADSADLNAFRRRGGKLIQYQGWTDYSVAPRDAIDYFNRVTATQRSEIDTNGVSHTQEFYRLFMVPGMNHCGGGDGANAFGQILAAPAPSDDAGHNIVTALDEWVEHGAAPARIVATKYVDDDKAKGIQFQRPLCPYPETAVYTGGDPASQSSFRCEEH
jgi:feruloyl esterase